MVFRSVILFALLCCQHFAFAQKDRKVVVMDMTAINQETNLSRYISTVRLMRSTGLPFEVTDKLDSAVLYPVIILGSRIEDDKLTPAQHTQLVNYVDNGGVLILSSMRDSALFDLCGISGYLSDDNMYSITWSPAGYSHLFTQINDPLELTVSIGDTASGPNFFTRAYYLNGGNSLGLYENGVSALVENFYGSGKVYTFGPDFRDIYLRNQLDFDVNAHRTYSNGFEPTSDVFMFLVRNIIRSSIPNSVYKYTSPGKSSATVMITHDIDSESGVDTMGLFSDLEQQRNIVAQYNLTTRYFNDGWMTSFYVGSNLEIVDLKNDGHVLSSHSVGHFPDFADESIFPVGSLGNTPTGYQPFYSSGITTDGTLLGELEVSKNLIETDHGVSVRSFRAGHLAYHDLLGMGLDTLGYEFNSTHSANNILTGFPFYDFRDRSFGSYEIPVLHIPLTISDVFASDPISSSNFMQKVEVWINATRKYEANNAPVNLLIHPNRLYKVTAQQAYLDSLSADIAVLNMEYFGDFWRKRDSLQFHTEKQGDSLLVYMDNALLHAEQSFVVDTIGIDTVLFFNSAGLPIAFDYKKFSSRQRLYYPHISLAAVPEEAAEFIQLYPNPVSQKLFFTCSGMLQNASACIYDLNGRQVYAIQLPNSYVHSIDLSGFGLSEGMYILKISHSTGNISRKFIYSH